MPNKDTGGSWESLGRRWSRDSDAPTPTLHTRQHEDEPPKNVLYSPKGDVIARVVDRDIKVGFRKDSK